MKTLKYLIILFLVIFYSCSSTRQFTSAPIKTFDPDNATIPPPKELEENQIWDLADMTFFYQVEKVLDLNWSARKVGRVLGISSGRQADNINALDDVPNSSWFTNRHFHNRMSTEELVRGPNITEGPDQSGPWTITRGKFEGGTPGFFIDDAKGDGYIIKFDAAKYQEMGSSAEAISTKILFACGYNVPQNTAEWINPKIFQIGETVTILDQGVERKMNDQDLEMMLKDIPRRSDGKIRVLASKYLSGGLVGIWNFKGTRKDDPNDRVAHEHRRELRGLRVIGSWLNDADRRAANTLAIYVEEGGNKFIKHYIIDVGSTLGSNNKFPHAPKYGYEYLVDLRTIGKSLVGLGLYEKSWEFEEGHINPQFPSVGYFEAEMFDPGSWVATYANPAFERCTLRDAFWGAKIVMTFTDEEITAIVKTAEMTNPDAEKYLIDTLIKRRDKIGRYWFSKINPLDKFVLKDSDGVQKLHFVDLAVNSKLEKTQDTQYRYQVILLPQNRELSEYQNIGNSTTIPIFSENEMLSENEISNNSELQFEISVQTKRGGTNWSKWIKIYLALDDSGDTLRIIGILRQE